MAEMVDGIKVAQDNIRFHSIASAEATSSLPRY